jgi:photosystem II stability/assembly factor-like uncharacterized protein
MPVLLLSPVAAASATLPQTWHTVLAPVGPTSFASLSCPTISICTAVGGGPSGLASIYRTTNDGSTWTYEAAPAGTPGLSAISCPTTSFCLAGGRVSEPTIDSSQLYVTTDGGATWGYASVLDSVGGYLDKLDCVTSSVCYAVDGGGLALSIDGGLHWSSSVQGVASVTGLSCPTSETCFTVGNGEGSSSSYVIEKWTGGAQDVQTVFSESSTPPSIGSPAISCTTARVCMAVGAGPEGSRVLTTADGGAKWRLRSMPNGLSLALDVTCVPGARCALVFARSGTIDEAVTAVGSSTWSTKGIATALQPVMGAISCPALAGCLLAGYGSFGESLFSQRAHTGTWRPITLAAGSAPLYSASCPTGTECVAVGDGTVLRSTDGGTAWSSAVVPFGPDVVLRSVSCSSATICVAVGAWSPAAGPSAAVVIRSTDGGSGWSHVTIPSGVATLQSVTCPTTSSCVAATGGSASTPSILYSTDGGETWSTSGVPTTSGVRIESISCAPASFCLGAGFDGNSNLIATSTDGGATWSFATGSGTPQLLGVSCSSATTCMAVGPGRQYQPGVYESLSYATTDGGQTWTQLSQLPGSNVVSVDCADGSCQALSTIPWGASPSTLATSVDGGSTWTTPTLPSASDVLFGATATPCGRWVVVGGDNTNGALILTS